MSEIDSADFDQEKEKLFPITVGRDIKYVISKNDSPSSPMDTKQALFKIGYETESGLKTVEVDDISHVVGLYLFHFLLHSNLMKYPKMWPFSL